MVRRTRASCSSASSGPTLAQVANSTRGLRLHDLTSPGRYRAATALLLLLPQTPMLFQGQEYAAHAPFHYFADHNEQLAPLIREGRRKEVAQFPSVASAAMQARLHDPDNPATFEQCKLDFADIEKPWHSQIYKLHKDLIRLRKSESAFRNITRRGDIDGAVLGPGAFVLRYFNPAGDDRLLLCNLDRDLQLDPCPEPLLAPPVDKRWTLMFTSEDPGYGGAGTPAPDTEQEGWFVQGRCTVVLKPVPCAECDLSTRVVARGSAQAPKKKEKRTEVQHGSSGKS